MSDSNTVSGNEVEDLRQTVGRQQDRIDRLEALLESLRSSLPGRVTAKAEHLGVSRAGLLKGVVAGAVGVAAAGVASALESSKALADDIPYNNNYIAHGLESDEDPTQTPAFFTEISWPAGGSTTSSYQCGASMLGTKVGVYGAASTGSWNRTPQANLDGPYGVYGDGTSLGVGVGGSSTAYDGVHGTTTGNGRTGVWGYDYSSGGGYGVAGYSTNGIGVYASVANNDAIQGHSTKAGKSGVAGFGDGSSSFGTFGQGYYGVWGRTINGRAGVLGTTAASGGPANGDTTLYGVYGDGTTNGVGVCGTSTVTDAIHGITTANTHSGVLGTDNSQSGGFGVYGTSTTGIGTYGITSGNGQMGVSGRDQSANGGTGVYGISVNGVGIHGESSGNDALQGHTTAAGFSGLYAHDSSTNGGYGVSAYSDHGMGVLGTSAGGDGIHGKTTANGSSGVSASDASANGGYAFYGLSQAGVGMYVESDGNDALQSRTTSSGRSGLYARDNSDRGGYGVYAHSDNGLGIYADSAAGDGIRAYGGAGARGVYGGNGDTFTRSIGVMGELTSVTPGQNSAAVLGQNDGTTGNGYGVQGSHAGSGWGGYFTSASGIGVEGSAAGSGRGVYGVNTDTFTLSVGVMGELSSATPGRNAAAVLGKNDGTTGNGYGVQGSHAGSGWGGYFNSATGTGVQGSAAGAGTGVYGVNTDTFTRAVGVLGELTSQSPGNSSAAIFGKNDGTNGNGSGVQGTHAGSGFGGYFTSTTGTGVYASSGGTVNGTVAIRGVLSSATPGTSTAAVFGNNKGTNNNGFGVEGAHAGGGKGGYFTSVSGIGVVGTSTSGRGGQFSGSVAQINLVPGATQGAPTTGAHAAGDIYVDSAKAIYFCTATGTPGTWKQVVLE